MLDGYDDFANLLVGLHVAMGFDDLGEWKDAVYARLEVAGCDVVENVALSLGPEFRFRKQFAESVSTNGQGFT